MLLSRRGPRFIPFLLAKPVFALSSIALTDVISGYGDHQWRFADFKGGTLADNNFRIHNLSDEFVGRLGSDEPIREIKVVGHADRAWQQGRPNTRDEDDISQKRADEVFSVLAREILGMSFGRITATQIRDMAIVVGVGARQRVTSNNEGAAPKNRRVEVELRLTASIPI